MEKIEFANRISKLVGVLEECADLNEDDDAVKSGAFGFIIAELALFMNDDEYRMFVGMMTTTRDKWIRAHPKGGV